MTSKVNWLSEREDLQGRKQRWGSPLHYRAVGTGGQGGDPPPPSDFGDQLTAPLDLGQISSKSYLFFQKAQKLEVRPSLSKCYELLKVS